MPNGTGLCSYTWHPIADSKAAEHPTAAASVLKSTVKSQDPVLRLRWAAVLAGARLAQGCESGRQRLSCHNPRLQFREAPDTFNFLRHVMRAIWSLRPKCSHRCVSLRETPLKPVQILQHTTKNSTEQTVMRTKMV